MTMPLRKMLIALGIATIASWSLAAAQAEDAGKEGAYARPDLVATPAWLQEQHASCVVVDVRSDEYFDGNLIPGAVRLPWSRFRQAQGLTGIDSTFVGTARAAEILGEHGIGRASCVVLYDSVARDGGATASYVFWVLDLLGHEQVRVLDGGIDAGLRPAARWSRGLAIPSRYVTRFRRVISGGAPSWAATRSITGSAIPITPSSMYARRPNIAARRGPRVCRISRSSWGISRGR